MKISEGDLATLVAETWAPSVGLEVSIVDPPDDDEVPFVGFVELTGAWNGKVAVEASEDFLRDLAVIMFGVPSDEVSDEDRLDALGELSNVMAGNVKLFAGGDCEMSLPTKGRKAPHDPSLPELGFSVGGHLARLRVVSDT